jgi:hypothetical protein
MNKGFGTRVVLVAGVVLAAVPEPPVRDRVPAESGSRRDVSPHLSGGAAAPRRSRAHPCRLLRGSQPHRRERVILQWLDRALMKGVRVPRAGTTLARRSNAIAVSRQIAVASLSSGR